MPKPFRLVVLMLFAFSAEVSAGIETPSADTEKQPQEKNRPEVPKTEVSPAPGAAQSDDAIDYTSDEAPPSTYDRKQLESPDTQDPSEIPIFEHLLRTILALAFVVGLVYIFGRWVLPRLSAYRVGKSTGESLKVKEKLQLDGKNALLWVEVRGGPDLLLGSGEHGVRLIQIRGENAAKGYAFQQHLDQASPARNPSKLSAQPDDTGSS